MNNQLVEEINIIINNLKEYFSFEELKENFSFSYISKNENELKEYISYLKEVESFSKKDTFSFQTISNLKTVFDNIKKGISIEIKDIVNIKELLILSSSFNSTFIKEKLDNLNRDANNISILTNLINKINKIITPDNLISDDASTNLKSIRKEIIKAKKNIEDSLIRSKEKYKTYLSEEIISSRDGFDVLLVKSKSISNVPGYVVSYSSTKESAYIVPLEVLHSQNQLTELINLEQIEINKILKDLYGDIKKDIDNIINNYQILIKWDRFFGSYNYGLTYYGSIATLSKEIIFNNLFHPLIGFSDSIKNSYNLSKDGKPMLFISGPNAGGKTVLLKASCICLIMFNLGLLVPCDNSSFPFFKNIVLISGDSQSIENSLSTFSSHLKELKEITRLNSDDSFIAIDEICNGTSPSDGVALSKSIIDYLNKNKIYSLITSHFDKLKEYVFNNKSVLSCSMEFSTTSLEPTFHLLTNSIGLSYGIELASIVGLDKEIIDAAKNYKKESNEYDIEETTKKLKDELKKEKELIKTLEEEKKELEDLNKKKKEVLHNIEIERKSIHDSASNKIKKEVDKRIKELNEIFSSYTSIIPLNKQIEFKTALKKVSELTPINTKKEKVFIPDLKKGDSVIDENNKYYQVLSVKKDKVVLLSDNIKLTRDIVGLKKSEYKEKKNISSSFFYKNDITSLPTSLNIIGMTIDEASREYISYLSKASLKKLHSVKIIHGIGSYKLKNSLWKYLENNQLVKSYRLGLENEGGLGVTIIELK